MSGTSPILPVWLVLPLAILTAVAVAGHLMAIQSEEVPRSRRRIRTVSGTLILFSIPLIAFAFGIATPNRPQVFMLSWFAVMGLLLIILVLAGVDLADTHRLQRRERERLRNEIAAARAELARMASEARERKRDAEDGDDDDRA